MVPSPLPSTLLLLMAASSAASSSTISNSRITPRVQRALEEDGYQYMEDLTDYQMQFGKCVRVKVPDDNDDEEGNSYFYNGHYYAQGQQFASFYLCDQYAQSDDATSECGVCDTSKEYVTDLATYLETTLEYANAMCGSCQALCNNRRLEDGEEEEGEEDEEEEEEEENLYMNVDCNTCVSTCYSMNFNYANQDNDDENDDNNGNDETQYLECQEAFEDENGIQIYAGPQCNGDGDIIIGFYYDEDCTVKSSSATMDYGFEYGIFRGLQSMCMSCNPYGDNGGDDDGDNDGEDVCQDLYDDAIHCADGVDLTGAEGDMSICKTYQKAHKEFFYSQRRSMRYVEIFLAIVFVVGLFWAFLTLSWTYYLRHRAPKESSDKKVPLTAEEHISEPEITISDKDIPPVS